MSKISFNYLMDSLLISYLSIAKNIQCKINAERISIEYDESTRVRGYFVYQDMGFTNDK